MKARVVLNFMFHVLNFRWIIFWIFCDVVRDRAFHWLIKGGAVVPSGVAVINTEAVVGTCRQVFPSPLIWFSIWIWQKKKWLICWAPHGRAQCCLQSSGGKRSSYGWGLSNRINDRWNPETARYLLLSFLPQRSIGALWVIKQPAAPLPFLRLSRDASCVGKWTM